MSEARLPKNVAKSSPTLTQVLNFAPETSPCSTPHQLYVLLSLCDFVDSKNLVVDSQLTVKRIAKLYNSDAFNVHRTRA